MSLKKTQSHLLQKKHVVKGFFSCFRVFLAIFRDCLVHTECWIQPPENIRILFIESWLCNRNTYNGPLQFQYI